MLESSDVVKVAVLDGSVTTGLDVMRVSPGDRIPPLFELLRVVSKVVGNVVRIVAVGSPPTVEIVSFNIDGTLLLGNKTLLLEDKTEST